MAPNLTIPSSALITGETTRAEAAETLRPTANSPLGDLLGRTQVLGTSTIAAPSLRQFVFVDDAPWGAKGDAKRVTDGAITAGTNQLSSTAAAFTSANTGQRIEVTGAGPTVYGANTFWAFIGTVSGGVASLVTTSGGSTPANATNTVTGATVTFGTDDTTAIQNAHNAVSTNGGGTVGFVAGKKYLMHVVNPVSNVTTWGYGATLYFISYDANCGFQSTSAIQFWSLRGLNMPDTNIIYTSGTRGAVFIPTIGCSDIGIFDNTVTNNRDFGFYLVDVPRYRICGNTLIGCCQGAGRNVINVSSSSTVETSNDVEVSGNYLQDNITLGIHFGLHGGASLVPNNFRAVVTNNRIRGNHAAGISMESSESGPGGPGASVVIANNPINLTSAASNAIAIGNAAALYGTNIKWVISGNHCESVGSALIINASDVTATGNYCHMTGVGTSPAGSGISTLAASTTVTATLDGTTATLTSVTYSAGANPIPNGTPLSGTGIPSGSWLVSGAGTGTWVISQNTTAAATETVTASLTNSNVNITGNTIHMAAQTIASNTIAGLSAGNLSYSNVSDNLVYFDPGSTVTTMYGLWPAGCFDSTFMNNRVTNASRWGIRATSSHDCDIVKNKIHNCNQYGTVDNAVNISSCFNMDVDENRIWDDTGASKFNNGIITATAGNIRCRRNIILNATSTPITGTGIIEQTDNRFTTGVSTGRAVLVAGTVTVSTTEIRSGDNVILTRNVAGGTIGEIQLGTITNGTSFVINSVQPGTASTVQSADTSTVYWRIDH